MCFHFLKLTTREGGPTHTHFFLKNGVKTEPVFETSIDGIEIFWNVYFKPVFMVKKYIVLHFTQYWRNTHAIPNVGTIFRTNFLVTCKRGSKTTNLCVSRNTKTIQNRTK